MIALDTVKHQRHATCGRERNVSNSPAHCPTCHSSKEARGYEGPAAVPMYGEKIICRNDEYHDAPTRKEDGMGGGGESSPDERMVQHDTDERGDHAGPADEASTHRAGPVGKPDWGTPARHPSDPPARKADDALRGQIDEDWRNMKKILSEMDRQAARAAAEKIDVQMTDDAGLRGEITKRMRAVTTGFHTVKLSLADAVAVCSEIMQAEREKMPEYEELLAQHRRWSSKQAFAKAEQRIADLERQLQEYEGMDAAVDVYRERAEKLERQVREAEARGHAARCYCDSNWDTYEGGVLVQHGRRDPRCSPAPAESADDKEKSE